MPEGRRGNTQQIKIANKQYHFTTHRLERLRGLITSSVGGRVDSRIGVLFAVGTTAFWQRLLQGICQNTSNAVEKMTGFNSAIPF